MKRNLLFIILCITTLTFTGCGKNETPVMSNSVETEVETETITTDEIIAEEVEETIENVTEEIIEEIETTTEISEGVPFEEGEYSEPPVQETENLSEYDARMQRFNEDMKKWYEAGIISEEEYKAAIEYEPEISESIVSEYIPSASDQAIIQQYEEAAIADRVNNTNGQGDQRTDIQYGQGDYTGLEHIRIN